MKLLLDENLSHRMLVELEPAFPLVQHGSRGYRGGAAARAACWSLHGITTAHEAHVGFGRIRLLFRSGVLPCRSPRWFGLPPVRQCVCLRVLAGWQSPHPPPRSLLVMQYSARPKRGRFRTCHHPTRTRRNPIQPQSSTLRAARAVTRRRGSLSITSFLTGFRRTIRPRRRSSPLIASRVGHGRARNAIW